jgi:hypothetical protein
MWMNAVVGYVEVVLPQRLRSTIRDVKESGRFLSGSFGMKVKYSAIRNFKFT